MPGWPAPPIPPPPPDRCPRPQDIVLRMPKHAMELVTQVMQSQEGGSAGDVAMLTAPAPAAADGPNGAPEEGDHVMTTSPDSPDPPGSAMAEETPSAAAPPPTDPLLQNVAAVPCPAAEDRATGVTSTIWTLLQRIGGLASRALSMGTPRADADAECGAHAASYLPLRCGQVLQCMPDGMLEVVWPDGSQVCAQWAALTGLCAAWGNGRSRGVMWGDVRSCGVMSGHVGSCGATWDHLGSRGVMGGHLGSRGVMGGACRGRMLDAQLGGVVGTVDGPRVCSRWDACHVERVPGHAQPA